MIGKIIEFESHGDNRGQLVSLEELKNIPFEIKRVYFMIDTVDTAVRGKHAHKDLQQILICVNGTCKILLDNGKEREIVVLDKSNIGLYISNNVWREMYDFSKNAVLMVIASDFYNESDYIRDYDDFIRYLSKK